MFISELHIQGYKRLRNVKLPLGPLTVLIGPNASGKTATLEVLEVLAASAVGQLSARLRDLGGVDSLLSRGDGVRRLTASLSANVEGSKAYEYRLEVDAPGTGAHAIAGEWLTAVSTDGSTTPLLARGEGRSSEFRTRGGATGKVGEPGSAETALSYLNLPDADVRTSHMRSFLNGASRFAAIPTTAGTPVRLPQQIRPEPLPGRNAEYLLSALHTTRARAPRMFDLIQDACRVAYPAFERLEIEAVAAGHVVLVWEEGGQRYFGNELSDGTLRFLWLLAILCAADPATVTMVDEPEVSLHPELLKILSGLLDDASHRTQLIVATQSPELIAWLKPEQVVVLDVDEDGWTTATAATELDLGMWLDRYTLGELWVQGTLGGRR